MNVPIKPQTTPTPAPPTHPSTAPLFPTLDPNTPQPDYLHWTPYPPQPVSGKTEESLLPEDIRPITECKGTGDLVFVADSSGSVGAINFHKLLNFVANVSSYLDVDNDKYRVGMVTFSEVERVEFNLTTHKNRTELLKAMQEVCVFMSAVPFGICMIVSFS